MVFVKSWLEISKERLAVNYGVLRAAAGAGTSVLGVVKANAYGHGVAVCAPVLAEAGAEWLGVTDVAEGIAVRAALVAAGIALEDQPKVLVMCGLLREDCAAVVAHQLTPVVWTVEHLEWLAGGAVGVHLEIDTGMARQGVGVGAELHEFLTGLLGRPELRLEGVMTHFASSEVAGSEQTRVQSERFEEALDAVMAAGFRPGWVHAGNSSTVDVGSSLGWLGKLAERVGARAMVRSGLGLYGYCLPIEGVDDVAKVQGGVRPVMTWKARVIDVREIAAGDSVGYNGTFVAERPMRLALLPVGYADGLRRELSSSNTRAAGWVMVHGRKAPVVGRVSMNLISVDVSGINGVGVGDEVVVLGDGCTAEDHARVAGTIAYEILCGVRAEPRLVD